MNRHTTDWTMRVFQSHLDYDLGFATLTSITSDRTTEMASNFDADFSGARLLKENKLNYDFDTLTQELRLSSNDDSEVQWSVGAFYAERRYRKCRTVMYGEELNICKHPARRLAGNLDGCSCYGELRLMSCRN